MTTISLYHNNSESIQQWAESTLDTDELTAFNAAAAANEMLWQGYITQGLVEQSRPILKDIYITSLGETVEVKIGDRTTVAAGHSLAEIPMDPAWQTWMDRYIAETDPLTIVIE